LLGRRHDIGSVVYTLHGVPEGLSNLVEGCAQAEPRRAIRDPLYYLGGERLAARLTPGPIVVPCAALADYVHRQLHQPADRVHVVHNGVDLDRFRPASPGIEQHPVTGVWVGLMRPVKRVDELVHAAAGVEGLALRLIGEGPISGQVAATIGKLGVGDRVRMCGFQDDPAAALAGADLFVLPSAAEAFPLALLQAMACGLPVVATRVAGVPELVRDGVDGILVDADDWAGLRAALQRLTGDAALRAAMGRRARERVATGFALDASVKRLLEVYEAAA
jgi:glycosyltransferase involved in cell wall biosynthesis